MKNSYVSIFRLML